MSLGEIFAGYRTDTKQIYGCKTKGLIYWHEERHSQQPTWLIHFVSIWLYAIAAVMALAAWVSGSLFLILAFAPPVLILLGLEADAWRYAVQKNLKEVKP